MKTMPTATTATMNDGTRISAAGDQIVVASGITPACCSRKLPGVAISSGALPDRPNCQIAPAPASTDISQRKSILMPLRSAWVAKWMAMTGASAIDRPQFRYATKPPAHYREQDDLRLRPRQARQENHRVLERGSRAEDEAQHEDERHLHRELQQHPQAAVVRVDRRRQPAAQAQRQTEQHDQQED